MFDSKKIEGFPVVFPLLIFKPLICLPSYDVPKMKIERSFGFASTNVSIHE